MIFGQDRNELRKMYAEAWKKQLAGQPMSPLELQIAAVVAQHPEYHDPRAGGDGQAGRHCEDLRGARGA
jgi:hypothetical protein